MQIAILSDIHGNLAALEAALDAVEKLRPDKVIFGGDVVDGAPDPAECWERVKATGCPMLRGNHERYVFDFGTERADPLWATAQFAPLHFTVNRVNEAQRAEMAALPLEWTSPDTPGLLVVHASQRSDADTILPHTPTHEIDPMFQTSAELIVRSHNHISSTRDWRGRRIVTTGAVGLPLDGYPRAQFCVVTLRPDGWQVQHHAVSYDVGATIRRFRETNYAEQTGPVGRMFMREVATGAHHVVPFLRYLWHRKQQEPTLTLEKAERDYFA